MHAAAIKLAYVAVLLQACMQQCWHHLPQLAGGMGGYNHGVVYVLRTWEERGMQRAGAGLERTNCAATPPPGRRNEWSRVC